MAQKIQIRIADLDFYGHVSNAVYLNFFESVHVTYFRVLSESLELKPLEARDLREYSYVIAVATVRYKAPSTSKTTSMAPRAFA